METQGIKELACGELYNYMEHRDVKSVKFKIVRDIDKYKCKLSLAGTEYKVSSEGMVLKEKNGTVYVIYDSVVKYLPSSIVAKGRYADIDLTSASVDIDKHTFGEHTGGLTIDGRTAILKEDARHAFRGGMFECLTLRNLQKSGVATRCDYMLCDIVAYKIVLENVSINEVSFTYGLSDTKVRDTLVINNCRLGITTAMGAFRGSFIHEMSINNCDITCDDDILHIIHSFDNMIIRKLTIENSRITIGEDTSNRVSNRFSKTITKRNDKGRVDRLIINNFSTDNKEMVSVLFSLIDIYEIETGSDYIREAWIRSKCI